MDAEGLKPRTLSELDALRLVGEDGRRLGRLFDLVCPWKPGEPQGAIEQLVHGRIGLLERVGLVRQEPASLPWSCVRRIERQAIVVIAESPPDR
ncbi:hypothetical protein [Ideonella sp. YS5]|uniref:hypothetical protein n=1 Tax=Ideonella sp. YS5 TaxID=3453714 RepID=UPI003EEEB844